MAAIDETRFMSFYTLVSGSIVSSMTMNGHRGEPKVVALSHLSNGKSVALPILSSSLTRPGVSAKSHRSLNPESIEMFVGHTRPLCNLASRLVQSRHVLITFLTTPAFHDRVKTELLRNLETEDTRLNCASRIR